ncbi:MAG: ribonuclease P protein component [Bacteroidota bacterium]
MPTFSKDERLCRFHLIRKLFSKGSSVTIYPYRMIWLATDEEIPAQAQVLFSYKRKAIRRATDRNRIRRLNKEAYRKCKHRLYSVLENTKKKCIFAIIYLDKNIPAYPVVEQKMNQLIDRLIEEYEKGSDSTVRRPD